MVLGACGMHGTPAQGGRIGAAGRRAMLFPSLSRPSAAGCAAGPQPQDGKSPNSPFCGRRGACPSRRAAPDGCSPVGKPHARPEWHGCEVRALALHAHNRPFTTQVGGGGGGGERNNARAGMQKRTRTSGSCTARSLGPLLSSDDHNSTSRNSWPSTRWSPISAPHCRVAAAHTAVIWLPWHARGQTETRRCPLWTTFHPKSPRRCVFSPRGALVGCHGGTTLATHQRTMQPAHSNPCKSAQLPPAPVRPQPHFVNGRVSCRRSAWRGARHLSRSQRRSVAGICPIIANVQPRWCLDGARGRLRLPLGCQAPCRVPAAVPFVSVAFLGSSSTIQQ
jgi:hypothetical protein